MVLEYLWPILAAVLGIALGAFLGYTLYKKSSEKRVGRAEEVAARLVDEAKNRAELLSKERINEAKEEVHRLRNECDRECKERRAEIQKSEKRFNQREEQLEKKFFALDTREDACVQKEKELQKQLAAAEELQKRRLDELERVAGLTANEAKEELVSAIENEARRDAAVLVRDMEAKAKQEGEAGFIYYACVAFQGRLGVPGKFKSFIVGRIFQKPVDGARLPPGGLRHALGRPAGRRGQFHPFALKSKNSYYTVNSRSLARARAARNYGYPPAQRGLNGLALPLSQFYARLFLAYFYILVYIPRNAFGRIFQKHQRGGHLNLRVIIGREINRRYAFNLARYKPPLQYAAFQRVLYRRLFNFQQPGAAFNQLLAGKKHIAFSPRLRKDMPYS